MQLVLKERRTEVRRIAAGFEKRRTEVRRIAAGFKTRRTEVRRMQLVSCSCWWWDDGTNN